MPAAIQAIQADDEFRAASDLPPLEAEHVKLWLPSELSADKRQLGCTVGLAEMELKLRVAQCGESLDSIRDRLHVKKHLINHRNKHVTGQNKSTRARRLIDRVGDRIKHFHFKYTRARDAIIELGGETQYGESFRVLQASHLTLDAEEDEPDDEASRQMILASGTAGPRAKKKKASSTSESTRVLSWIWVAGDAAGTTGVHGCKGFLNLPIDHVY